MPTERYLNLSEPKRRKIRMAVLQEYKEYPLENISFKRIARIAGISRGSLYTYFKNKDDALTYVLEETQSKLWEYSKESLQKQQGDFWSMLEDSLIHDMDLCEQNNWNWLFSQNDIGQFSNQKQHEFFQWIYEGTDKERFCDMPKEEFDVLQEICFSLLVLSLQDYARHGRGEKETILSFRKKLHQIKKGVCREKQIYA